MHIRRRPLLGPAKPTSRSLRGAIVFGIQGAGWLLYVLIFKPPQPGDWTLGLAELVIAAMCLAWHARSTRKPASATVGPARDLAADADDPS